MRSSITGYKDTDLLVLEILDDKSLFSVMQTNKAYSELPDSFFEKRTKQKYPYLAVYKPEYQTWKYFYIHNSYYIGKLKEEYDLDYVSFPGPNCKPEKIYKQLTRFICLDNTNYMDKNKERKEQKLREFKQRRINDVKKDFYIYQNKKDDLLKLLDEYDDPRIDVISEYLKMGDVKFLDILKKRYPNDYKNFVKYRREYDVGEAIKQLDFNFLDKHKNDFSIYHHLSTAIETGEINMVKYILSNITKKYGNYAKSIANAVSSASMWDDEALFKYLFDIVLSFKDPKLLKLIKRNIKDILICARYAKKYLKYF